MFLPFLKSVLQSCEQIFSKANSYHTLNSLLHCVVDTKNTLQHNIFILRISETKNFWYLVQSFIFCSNVFKTDEIIMTAILFSFVLYRFYLHENLAHGKLI